MCGFSHLHCHSQYSLLDGAAAIPGMVGKASRNGMPGLAITDHGNMFGVPVSEVNRIAKLFPERAGMDTFEKVIDPDVNPDTAGEIKALFDHPDSKIQKMMSFARTLEGCPRQTRIHAAGVIIAPGKVSGYVPVALSKEKDVITQYDGPASEMSGLLKMDFFGLRTLSILKTAIKLVGSSAVEHFVEERRKNGLFHSIFDVTSRVDLRTCN